MWFKKYTQKIVLVAALLCVFFVSSPVARAVNIGECKDVRDKQCYLNYIKNHNETTEDRKYWIPLQIPIPFPTCSSIENFLCVQGSIVGLRSVADLVVGLFQFGVIAIAITMVLIMVIGGAVYLTAGGSADYVSKAKDMMKKSFWGLLVALLSFTILYQVDPRLTSPDLTKLETVEEVPCCKVKTELNEYYFAEYKPEAGKYECNEGDEKTNATQCLLFDENYEPQIDTTGEIEGRVAPTITGDKSLLISKIKANSRIKFKESKLVVNGSKVILQDHLDEMKDQMLRVILTVQSIIGNKDIIITSLNEPEGTHKKPPHCSGAAVDFRSSNLTESEIKSIFLNLYDSKDVSQFLYCIPEANGEIDCGSEFAGFTKCSLRYSKSRNPISKNLACSHRNHLHIGYGSGACNFAP